MNHSKKKFSILLMIVTLILSLSLSACKSTPKKIENKESTKEQSYPKAEETVKSFFTAMQNKDFGKSLTYVKNGDDFKKYTKDKYLIDASNDFLSKLSYKILSSTTEGDKAKVKVKITTPDSMDIVTKAMYDLMPTLVKKSFDSKALIDENYEDIINSIKKHINDPKVKLVSNETEISLIKNKKNNDWLIIKDENLENALTGNLRKAIDKFNKTNENKN